MKDREFPPGVKNVMRVKEAAEKLGILPISLAKRIKDGRFPAVKYNGWYYVRESEVAAEVARVKAAFEGKVL